MLTLFLFFTLARSYTPTMFSTRGEDDPSAKAASSLLPAAVPPLRTRGRTLAKGRTTILPLILPLSPVKPAVPAVPLWHIPCRLLLLLAFIVSLSAVVPDQLGDILVVPSQVQDRLALHVCGVEQLVNVGRLQRWKDPFDNLLKALQVAARNHQMEDICPFRCPLAQGRMVHFRD